MVPKRTEGKSIEGSSSNTNAKGLGNGEKTNERKKGGMKREGATATTARTPKS